MARGRDNTIQASGRQSQRRTDQGARAPSEVRLHSPYQHRQARSLTTQVRRAARAMAKRSEEGGVVIRAAVEADLPGIPAIYNEVILTSTAIYTDDLVSLEDRTAWFAARQAQ